MSSLSDNEIEVDYEASTPPREDESETKSDGRESKEEQKAQVTAQTLPRVYDYDIVNHSPGDDELGQSQCTASRQVTSAYANLPSSSLSDVITGSQRGIPHAYGGGGSMSNTCRRTRLVPMRDTLVSARDDWKVTDRTL